MEYSYTAYRLLSLVLVPWIEFRHCLSVIGYSFFPWVLALLLSQLLETWEDLPPGVPAVTPLLLLGLPAAFAQVSYGDRSSYPLTDFNNYLAKLNRCIYSYTCKHFDVGVYCHRALSSGTSEAWVPQVCLPPPPLPFASHSHRVNAVRYVCSLAAESAQAAKPCPASALLMATGHSLYTECYLWYRRCLSYTILHIRIIEIFIKFHNIFSNVVDHLHVGCRNSLPIPVVFGKSIFTRKTAILSSVSTAPFIAIRGYTHSKG